MHFVKPPEYYSRFDDFLLDIAAICFRALESGALLNARSIERIAEFSANSILTGLLCRPVVLNVLGDETSYIHIRPLDSSQRHSIDILLDHSTTPSNPDATIEERFDFIVAGLTANPRRLFVAPSLWEPLCQWSYEAFLQCASSCSQRDKGLQLAATSLLFDSMDTPLSDALTPFFADGMDDWINSLSLASEDTNEVMFANRLATRMITSYHLFYARYLYDLEGSHLKNIHETLSALSTLKPPDANPEIYATRCEYYAYLCKKLSFTKTDPPLTTKQRVQHHIDALHALKSGISAYPRIRLAKYVADHIGCIASITKNEPLAMAGKLVYSIWYAMMHGRALHDILTSIQSRPDGYTVVSGIMDTTCESIRTELHNTHPLNIDPIAIMSKHQLTQDAPAMRDFFAGAIHAYSLARSAPDELSAFLKTSNINVSKCFEDIPHVINICGVLHMMSSFSCHKDFSHKDVYKMIIDKCWYASFPSDIHAEVVRALGNIIERLEEMQSGKLVKPFLDAVIH